MATGPTGGMTTGAGIAGATLLTLKRIMSNPISSAQLDTVTMVFRAGR